MARVSVLMPSYNHEAFLDEAVSSVLRQTLADFELVIVDDGSTDGSWAKIEAFDDARIVRHRQPNRGAHAALNKAGELCSPTSEYLAILNSDDAWDPRWLEAALRVLDSRTEAGFCCARVRMIGPEQDPRMAWRRSWYQDAVRHYRESGDVEASLLHANFIVTTSNVVVRRELFRASGGFRALRYVHDLDFFLRLARASELALVEEELVTYRYHEANTIGESASDERPIVFEFGWILAGLLEQVVARTPDPEELQRRVLTLIRAQPRPAVAAVALAILMPRRASAGAGARAPLEDLLRDGHPVKDALIGAVLDPRAKQVAEMESTIAEQLRALADGQRNYEHLRQSAEREAEEARRGIRALNAEITRLRQTRSYRIGDAISSTRGIGDVVRLPVRLARIALEKRASGDSRGS
jgi:GT2 family glycosyltransferase